MDDEQYFIDREIGKATLECIDPDWDDAVLTVDLSQGKVSVSLRRLTGGDIAVLSEELEVAIGHLEQHHRDTHSDLQSITYTYRRKPDGKWKFEADFTYPQDH